MGNDNSSEIKEREEVVMNDDEMSSLLVSSFCEKERIPMNNNRRRMDVHFVFLIHGWLGTDCSLSYVESTMKQQVEKCQKQSNVDDVVFHKVKCNLGQTHDGIVAGAKRLNHEIYTFVQQYYNNNIPKSNITRKASVSLWGHSLGGLYARCAMATFPWHIPITTTTTVELIPNVFVTSVTPHLGCSSHTYIPIPTCLKRMIGYLMRQTGQDLFDPDGILYTMSTSYHYLQPLSKFQKRIAYTNAFQTDFQVPTASAAFLSPSSTYLHQVILPTTIQ